MGKQKEIYPKNKSIRQRTEASKPNLYFFATVIPATAISIEAIVSSHAF